MPALRSRSKGKQLEGELRRCLAPAPAGIQSHFDDSDRFAQPIYSLRLFSDSRLSFGTQLYGYTNGAFAIPMPRGCVTVMEVGAGGGRREQREAAPGFAPAPLASLRTS